MDFIVQPVVVDGRKIQTPFNHDGGTVRCVFESSEYKRAQPYQCKNCNKACNSFISNIT